LPQVYWEVVFATVMTDVFQKKLNYNVIKIAKTVRISLEIEYIKRRGSYFGAQELDQYFPRYGAPQCDPLVFDVFYLQQYSHGFSNFNDIVVQFLLKNIGHGHGNTTGRLIYRTGILLGGFHG